MMPFKMRQETAFEKWRAETFWEKEPESLAWISSFNPREAFIDVGANIGVYSLYAASLFPKMSIFAIEPSRYNFESLVHNNKINDFNIQCYNFGASDHFGGKMRFCDADDIPGASGGQLNAEKGYEVTLTTLETIMLWHQKDDSYNIKVDIDGQELAVIKGIGAAWPKVRSLLIEVNENREEIIEIVESNGFTKMNKFNTILPHSWQRREKEGITAENIIFVRR